jgi:hypothetical protein
MSMSDRTLNNSAKPMRTLQHFFKDEASCSDDSDEDVEDIDDEDDEEEILIEGDESERKESDVGTLVDPPQKKKKSSPEIEKQPGNIMLPINCFSLTITKTKDDVPQALLQRIFRDFIEAFCLKGGIATEVGARLGNCHLQSVIQLHCLKTQAGLTALSKIILVNIFI